MPCISSVSKALKWAPVCIKYARSPHEMASFLAGFEFVFSFLFIAYALIPLWCTVAAGMYLHRLKDSLPLPSFRQSLLLVQVRFGITRNWWVASASAIRVFFSAARALQMHVSMSCHGSCTDLQAGSGDSGKDP